MHDPAAVKDLNIKIAPAPFTLTPNNNGGSGHCLIQTDRKYGSPYFPGFEKQLHPPVCFHKNLWSVLWLLQVLHLLHLPRSNTRWSSHSLRHKAKQGSSCSSATAHNMNVKPGEDGETGGEARTPKWVRYIPLFLFYAASSYTWGDCFDSVSVFNWEKRNQRHPCKWSSVVSCFVGFQCQGMF